MLRLLIILAFLVASVWLGITAIHHPGYLLIFYKPWMIQMPLWFAVLAAVVFIVLFYLLIDSIDRIYLLGYRIRNWFKFRRENKFYSKTQQGLTALIEGHWKNAEQLLLAGTNQSLEPLVNYLGAAKAAQEQNATDRRDTYIKDAYKVAPKADLAIGLTQAELEMKQEQYERALATLNHLREVYPRNPQVLRLLEKIYIHLGNWNELKNLLPSMRKSRIITAEQAATFEKNLYCEIFRNAKHSSLEELHAIWNDVPRSVKKNPDVVYEYVKELQKYPAQEQIEDLIRKTLNHAIHPGLVRLYSDLKFENLNKQLVIAGGWLKEYGPKQELLLLLGKLCVQVQLWGKAKDYFDRCLEIGPCAEASLEYGNLLEDLGEHEAALQQYREGLAAA